LDKEEVKESEFEENKAVDIDFFQP